MNIFLKWFLICGLGRVGQKRWPSIYLVRPGSDHQQYLMSIRTRVFCQPPISCRAILFYWRLEYWYPWAKLCVPFQISLSCTLFNELVINLFGCFRVVRLSGLKVRFHTFSSNSFLLLLRTFERICWSAQIVGKCFEKWAETQIVKMVVCKAQILGLRWS